MLHFEEPAPSIEDVPFEFAVERLWSTERLQEHLGTMATFFTSNHQDTPRTQSKLREINHVMFELEQRRAEQQVDAAPAAERVAS